MESHEGQNQAVPTSPQQCILCLRQGVHASFDKAWQDPTEEPGPCDDTHRRIDPPLAAFVGMPCYPSEATEKRVESELLPLVVWLYC